MEALQLSRSTAVLGFTTSFFISGIYFSSSQLTVPLLYPLPIATSTSIFAGFYHRGLLAIAPLSTISILCTGNSAYIDSRKRRGYLVAAGFLVATLAYTRLVMMSTIEKLIMISTNESMRATVGQDVVISLLKKWKFQTFVRSALAGLGGMVGIVTFLDGLTEVRS